jgi:hypothetical protein
MGWFWCQLINNYGSPVRVVIISQYGQGLYFINPGQSQWVQWYPGVKVLIAFDQFTGQLVTTYAFTVNGPLMQTVFQQNIPMTPGQPYSAQPPSQGGAGPTS